MSQKRDAKPKKNAARPKKSTSATNEKVKVKHKTASSRTKVKLKTRPQLIEPQDTRRKSSTAYQKGTEHAIQRRRVSFVIRLTLNANDEFERIEIEHVLSNKVESKKQSFVSLNGEDLVAFIKECVNTEIKTTYLPRLAPVNKKVESYTPAQLLAQPTLLVSDLELLDSKNTNITGLSLVAENPFLIQLHFQLRESEFNSLTNDELSYKIKIHVTEITTGISNLLVTHHARLIPGIVEYTVPVAISALAQGIYRLFTVIRLEKQIKMAGFYDGPVIQVI